MGEFMKNKLGTLLRKIAFAFGIIYGLNVVLKNTGIYIPINLISIGVTSFLGVPGLLSILAIFFIIN